MTRWTDEQKRPVMTWPTSSFAQRCCWVIIAVGGVLAPWIALRLMPFAGLSYSGSIGGSVTALAVVFVAWRTGIYPRLIATPYGLIIKNPTFARYVPWSQVAWVAPARDGLRITRVNGRWATVWAIQNNAWPLFLGLRQRRGDSLCAQVMVTAERHGAPLHEPTSLTLRRHRE